VVVLAGLNAGELVVADPEAARAALVAAKR
jgi:hypothetical protein